MDARTRTVRRAHAAPAAGYTAAEEALKGRADIVVATLVSVVVMVRIPLPAGLTVGDVVAILLIPVWLRTVGRYRFGPALLSLLLLAAASGAIISLLDLDRTSDTSLLVTNSGYIIGVAVSAGALLWARSVLGIGRVAVLAGLGLLLQVPLTFDASSPNPWKFGLEIPVMLFVLALAAWTGRRWIELVALGILGVVDLLADSRSATAMVLMTFALIAWQSRPMGRDRRGSTVRTLLGIAVLGSMVYFAVTALIFGGALGQGALERSEAQIEASGSLLTGGRPELGASGALIADQPLGFGSGTLPTAGDVLVAKSGMAELGYDPNNGYVENYLFGYGFEVHSIVGDLWIRYGLVGLAVALALAALALASSGSRVASRSASALLVFLSVRILWELAFGPLYTMLPVIILFITLALSERRPATTTTVSPTPRDPQRLHP